ncbi:phosphonate ABC transporter ATP-binding protein [Bacillus shivajii]|uniref:phosphonate ABC transporter ATP-binding protein n=1 Tax=Bacillus shivajii TaxID=1983719 RepID=UPI001CFAB6C2|nr:phosphonate ABC transporter ATP-binding protein [Bacillus shivajii]UCZ52447.1 phosphonate ABC transporter ATP-binding protein [Bacillus shivajii]
MIKLENVTVRYPKAIEDALKNINVTFEKREFVCVLGRSGAGKSTFIRTINGLQPLTNGSVFIEGTDLHEQKEQVQRVLRTQMGMIFQHFQLIPRMTVRHNVLTGTFGRKKAYESLLGLFSTDEKNKAARYVQEVGLSSYIDQKIELLSGGQKQRVGIARALMQEPSIFLADEPVASLDPNTAKEIFELLQTIHNEKQLITIINVHDVSLAKQFATRIIGLKNGELIFDGRPSQFNEESYRLIYD